MQTLLSTKVAFFSVINVGRVVLTPHVVFLFFHAYNNCVPTKPSQPGNCLVYLCLYCVLPIPSQKVSVYAAWWRRCIWLCLARVHSKWALSFLLLCKTQRLPQSLQHPGTGERVTENATASPITPNIQKQINVVQLTVTTISQSHYNLTVPLQSHSLTTISQSHYNRTVSLQSHSPTTISQSHYILTVPLQSHSLTTISQSHYNLTVSLQSHSLTTISQSHYNLTVSLQSYSLTTVLQSHYNLTASLQSHGLTTIAQSHYSLTVPLQSHSLTTISQSHYNLTVSLQPYSLYLRLLLRLLTHTHSAAIIKIKSLNAPAHELLSHYASWCWEALEVWMVFAVGGWPDYEHKCGWFRPRCMSANGHLHLCWLTPPNVGATCEFLVVPEN